MSSGEPPFQAAISDLYCEHHGWLFGWLRRKLGCAHNAADLAQDTFARILNARESVASLREPRAFLSTTARRLIIDQVRRKHIENAYLQELALTAEALEGFQSPEHILSTLEALEHIAFMLEGLHDNVRQAFVLYYLDGLTQSEIARQLGLSDRTVRKYLIQALLHCSHSLDT
ncbi:MAG TPA: RNA polymerase subunit sigma [Pseudomonas sp.]|jgi:RNA polymerase sigma-70 factor (ECF subfamily)|uniref:Sigma-70 family RNA polymerase sigma factor n=1 Tax=Pseudomonas helleri TaxID=1608996 RepID=A0A6A7ZEC3_9PSED|nr:MULTISPECIES: sigma-70 family RNA polymerase sigma factor [Pseudomonas]KMN23916.1 RNA polymerase sigma factor [Pseudomonas helleri]MQT40816.1 sigma-70 family RNA polymerase sigma factor [Pseudomonas sp. FSL R10-0765]MQT51418.1 sigma-70 family RNA polymerase sigma factor [Pseudomonas sp. FSL R10-2398]MQT78081.1 sigma-70 family RNA polymerase sigma factor [Pseudomonas helleri]MQT96701.1 sigma-70 family RNA polymerase sigma factor [Pseudomonas helleri]